jgi:hypothetical protein
MTSKPQSAQEQLNDILNRLDFTEETLPTAVLEQASLYMDAARYRIQKMRKKNAAELAYDTARAKRALNYRRNAASVAPGKKSMTETHLNQLLDADQALASLKKALQDAELAEEWSRNLQEAMRMRRDMIEVYARMMGPDSSEMRVKGSDALSRAKRSLGDRMPKGEQL